MSLFRIRPAGLLLVIFALAGCKSCSPPQAPDEYVIERFADPYDKAPLRGAVSDRERVRFVLKEIGKQLEVGDIPANVLDLRRGEAWTDRLVLLMSEGSNPKIAAGWFDMFQSILDGTTVPMEIKVKLRQTDALVHDYVNTNASEDTLRSARLVSIGWMLYELGAITPDSGYEK